MLYAYRAATINKYSKLRFFILLRLLIGFFLLSRGEVQSTSTLNDWARYVDRMNKQDRG